MGPDGSLIGICSNYITKVYGYFSIISFGIFILLNPKVPNYVSMTVVFTILIFYIIWKIKLPSLYTRKCFKIYVKGFAYFTYQINSTLLQFEIHCF